MLWYLLDFIGQKGTFVGSDDGSLIREDGTSMPILLLLQLLQQFLG
jgi:hypothetical protein